MPRNLSMALIFAGLMIVFAVLARMGLADRQTVQTLMIILPIIAITSLYRTRSRQCCDDASAGA